MSSKKVTKYDIVEAIYKEANCERNVVQQVVELFLDQIKSSLEQGATIELRGFGTFEPRLRKGRDVARNPKTGATLSVAPHYVAAFRAGQELKNNLLNLEIKENNE